MNKRKDPKGSFYVVSYFLPTIVGVKPLPICKPKSPAKSTLSNSPPLVVEV